MGIRKFLYLPDILSEVILNESIEVGKMFSAEQSGRSIHRVLYAVLEDLRSHNSLHKDGYFSPAL